MKNQFKVINRVTGEEQVFNLKEFKRFFHCEYDPQKQKVKYNNDMNDYAISTVKEETWTEVLGFSLLGLAIVVLVTKIILSWIVI